MAEYAARGHCCLCGNHGTIDTRGKVFTPAGVECGDRVFCICPNGRASKRALERQQAEALKPYRQGDERPLITVRWPHGGWLVWNWDAAAWDRHAEHPAGVQ